MMTQFAPIELPAQNTHLQLESHGHCSGSGVFASSVNFCALRSSRAPPRGGIGNLPPSALLQNGVKYVWREVSVP